jgi:ribonuclease T1
MSHRASRRQSQQQLLIAVMIAVLVLIAGIWSLVRDVQPADQSAPAPAAVQQGRSGLATTTPDQLPPEARETIALIDRGGPFPFRQDGTVFQNREGLLPAQPSGYYHEYTVVTPGENDRGARRIVAGDGGELYYTDDHYDSFVEVVR